MPRLTHRGSKERQQEEERKVCARHTERKVWKVCQSEKTLAISQGCRRLWEINELRQSVEWQSLPTQTEKKRRGGGGKSGLTQWLPTGSIFLRWSEVKHLCERAVWRVCVTHSECEPLCVCVWDQIRRQQQWYAGSALLRCFVLNRSGMDWHHGVHHFLSSFPLLLLPPSPPLSCVHSYKDKKCEQLAKYLQKKFPQTEHFSCYN